MKLSRQAWVSIRAMIVFTVVLGVLYPAAIWVIGLAMPSQSNGSLVRQNGQVVGSSLIGQSFTDKKGNALPEWFQSRPSAAGDGYDGAASSGSNYGPENKDLIKAIKQRQADIEKSDGVTIDQIPADAVTASGSGLDPDISEAYALIQVDRVAQARGLSPDAVHALVEQHVEGRQLGYLGEPTVNVLELNIAVAALKP
ncbi:MAG TPA: potassium-transporting ATPase subunit KdpC [Pseudolysinimonas sp.]|jgi:K+-transporting ATPase ATPase C chain